MKRFLVQLHLTGNNQETYIKTILENNGKKLRDLKKWKNVMPFWLGSIMIIQKEHFSE